MVNKEAQNTPWVQPVAIVIVLVLVLGGFLLLERASQKALPPPPPLTAEARAYAHFLKLSNVQMKAHENYLKQSVVEIVGDIGNQGERTLKRVEITCVFYDALGQLVLRQRVAIVSPKIGVVPPGVTKPFRLAFDDVPESWSQAMPQLVIAGIEFQ